MTTSRDAGDDLLRILDELDQLITSARSMPMSASAIVNRDDALALIDSARHSVPTAVRRAEEIVADADDVLAQGREESERIVLHAQEEAERLAASENVVRMAHERAGGARSRAPPRGRRLLRPLPGGDRGRARQDLRAGSRRSRRPRRPARGARRRGRGGGPADRSPQARVAHRSRRSVIASGCSDGSLAVPPEGHDSTCDVRTTEEGTSVFDVQVPWPSADAGPHRPRTNRTTGGAP